MEEGRLCSMLVDGLTLHPLNRTRLGDMLEFTEDVRVNGVQVPLIVRGVEGAWQVIAGARRLTAARTVGLETVPAIQVNGMDDDEAWQFLMRENMQRENVHPLDEARYFDQCQAAGQRMEDIVLLSGKGLAYVHQRLRLLELLPAVATAYEAGKISHSVAMVVARITPAAQKEVWTWIQEQIEWEGGMSAPQVLHWMNRQAVLTLGNAPFDTTDAELWPAAGACHDCPKRTGNTPSLFGELDDKDGCTDFKCWEQKTSKHMEAQIARWKAEGVEWTPLADYHEGKDKFKGRDIQVGYMKSTKKNDGKVGLIVRGQPPKLGTVVYWKSQQAHYAAERIQRTPAEVAASRRVKRQQRVKAHYRTLVFEELGKHNPKGADDLQFIALNVYDGLWHESRKQIAKSLGWELLKQKQYDGFDHYATAKKRLAAMGPAELMRFLHMCALIKTIDRNDYRGADHLMARAKALKIKTPALLKKAEAKFPPVKKATRKRPDTKKGKANARTKKQ